MYIIEKLKLSNFRCFANFEIDLHEKLTVLIAPNGGGKTTVLDAARVALWPYVKGFDLGSQTGKGATIQIVDVRLVPQSNGNMEAQLPSQIKASGTWDAESQVSTWAQTRERVKPGTNTLSDVQTKRLTTFAGQLEQQVRTPIGTVVTLPLISHLGTSRLWFEGRFTSIAEDVALNTSDYSRTSGYLNCLSYSSSFKTFTTWYGWIFRSYREEQIAALEQNRPLSEVGQRFATAISVVTRAIDTLTKDATGWHRLEYRASQHQQLVMHHEQFGSMPVDMLSDGVRNVIAMVADLAFRAYKLNPHLGADAALKTPGIALIDEVDMFLHPSWQQIITRTLCSAFPELQFIVTTHSPQVLSTIHRENIRIIGQDASGNAIAQPPLAMTYGEPSGDVLHSVMMVDPQPPIAEKTDLQRLTEWVDQGYCQNKDEAKQLMTKLNAILGEQHPQLQRLQRSIQRQKALKG